MTDMESAVNRDNQLRNMASNRLFGHKIRALREAKRQEDPRRFTLCQFAAAVGISPTFMSRIERGDSNLPAADKIIKMAELLGVNADELLALGGKVDPDLEKIIKEQPQALSDLLRTVRGMSAEEIRKLTERITKSDV